MRRFIFLIKKDLPAYSCKDNKSNKPPQPGEQEDDRDDDRQVSGVVGFSRADLGATGRTEVGGYRGGELGSGRSHYSAPLRENLKNQKQEAAEDAGTEGKATTS